MLPPKIRTIEQNNRFVRSLLFILRKTNTTFQNLKFEVKTKLRTLGYQEEKYAKLKRVKNIHNNERCFIVATGPSLTVEDMEKLKSEYTFGMNSICLVFDRTDFRPSYFGIQDEHVYEKVKKNLVSYCKENVFVSSNIYKAYDTPQKWITFPLNLNYHSFQMRYGQEYFAKFSDDCYSVVYDGYSITYSLIQIAAYMGFKEIYLLGCDCSYSDDKNKQHFVESGHYDPTYKTAGERMIAAYKVAKEYADAHGIKIYNATRGGMLEVFPRVDLDEVLVVKEKK